MKIINFGIIGFGKIGPKHKEKIEKNCNCNLIAICDIDKNRLKEIKNPDIELYTDYREMLKNADIDVVSVCTPNYLHAQMTIDVLNAGKHVICEKPMALSTQDCEKMIDAKLKNNRKLFVVKQNRYNPPVQAVRNLLNENKLGKLFFIVLNCYWNRNKDYFAASIWKGSREKDGGALFTQFSHFIDLMYWFAGEVKSVYALANNFNHPEIEIEDTGVVALEFVNGAIGTINFTNCAYKKNMEGSLTLFGEKGTVKIGGEYLNILEYQKIENFEISNLPKGSGSNDYGTYKGSMSNHDKVYENVVDVLNKNGNIKVDGIEGMQTVKIIENIYKSIKSGDKVSFD
jgi:predicted dehydrogenase